jgi:SAM-dependent methyltransferase
MDNKDKFSGKADGYDKYRPLYPTAVYDYILAGCDISCAQIADIGAGTGIFSLPLLQRGYNVVCVEPNADMKKILDEKAGGFVNFISIAASAENTKLLPASFDLVAVAQAFHWFDRQAFKRECERILKPNGKVALIWNVKDETCPVMEEIRGITKKYCKDYKGFSGGISKIDKWQFSDFFVGECTLATFENDICDSDEDTFVGRCLSSSYALKKGDENYDKYVDELTELYYKYESKGAVVIKNKTVVYLGRV